MNTGQLRSKILKIPINKCISIRREIITMGKITSGTPHCVSYWTAFYAKNMPVAGGNGNELTKSMELSPS
jgi:hypothetical protein